MIYDHFRIKFPWVNQSQFSMGHVFAYGSKTVLLKRTFSQTGRRGLCWGGVGVLTFCLVRTVDVAKLQRSLVSLLRYMLLRCRDLWYPCYVIATLQRSLVSLLRTCCYAAEISGILATLHFATLQRSLVSLLRYMLLRCRDLWYPCYVTCCYAAEISGILATLHVATLQRSLVSLLRYMLLRCRDLWYPCYVTCCYAAEISGILATLHVATLQRSLVSLLRYMLLRCRDLWYPCYVTCCYAAEISGILATLHVATLQRSLVSLLRYMLLRCRDLWYPCYVTCCYAAEISGILATLHVATLQRSLVSLLRYMLLRCRDLWYPCYMSMCDTIVANLWKMSSAAAPPSNARHYWCCVDQLQTISSQTHWVPGTKMSCYMPKCGNGASSISTRSCLRRLQRCCERSSEKKDAWICPIEIEKKNCV